MEIKNLSVEEFLLAFKNMSSENRAKNFESKQSYLLRAKSHKFNKNENNIYTNCFFP